MELTASSPIDAIAAFVTAGIGVAIVPPYAIARYPHLRPIKIREHDFRWSLNAVVLRRRRLTAAPAALLKLADAHLIHQPGVQRMSSRDPIDIPLPVPLKVREADLPIANILEKFGPKVEVGTIERHRSRPRSVQAGDHFIDT